MKPKIILIVTYYWPPAGGPGVQRWLKFVKYLPQFGWKPVVFIPENPNYPLEDKSLCKDVSKDLTIIKNKIWEPYKIAEKLNKRNKKFKAGQFDIGQNQSWKSKLSIWMRGNFFIPDARVFWVKPSVRVIREYLRENAIDALVTTGPPHSVHLIGLALKKEFPNLKWIADFRDPWTEISYYQYLKLTKWADRKHRRLEHKVFSEADITLATSYTDADKFKAKGANAVCITNGFDEAEMFAWSASINEKFCLSYIGVLEQLRNPEVLWETLSEIIKENPDFQKDFQLKFAGRVDDTILDKLSQSNLKENILNLGYISHNEALMEMKKSAVLLLTNFPQLSSKGIIPGKLFEYLATGKTILSFGPKDADVQRILEETHAGKHFGYNEKTELKAFLIKAYGKWKNNEHTLLSKNTMQFSRLNLTKRLSEVLSGLLNKN